jgi:hypothetical protein
MQMSDNRRGPAETCVMCQQRCSSGVAEQAYQSVKRCFLRRQLTGGVCRWVFRVGLPPNVLVELVDKLADVEYRLAYGTSEKLQLGSLVAAFMDAREGVVAAAK